MISLTLLYSTILPLLLQLVLGIWHTSEGATDSPETHTDLRTLSGALQILPESMRAPLVAAIRECLDLWNRTDHIWAGTKLLGGMSAGFGLRVILPTRPIETTMIVLCGWTAVDLARRLVLHLCSA